MRALAEAEVGDATAPSDAAQHMRALAEANERRVAMARRRREIGALDRERGAAAIAESLREPNPIVGGMRVMYLLRCCRGVGPEYARRLIATAGLKASAETLRVRELGEPARWALARRVSARARELARRGETRAQRQRQAVGARLGVRAL